MCSRRSFFHFTKASFSKLWMMRWTPFQHARVSWTRAFLQRVLFVIVIINAQAFGLQKLCRLTTSLLSRSSARHLGAPWCFASCCAWRLGHCYVWCSWRRTNILTKLWPDNSTNTNLCCPICWNHVLILDRYASSCRNCQWHHYNTCIMILWKMRWSYWADFLFSVKTKKGTLITFASESYCRPSHHSIALYAQVEVKQSENVNIRTRYLRSVHHAVLKPEFDLEALNLNTARLDKDKLDRFSHVSFSWKLTGARGFPIRLFRSLLYCCTPIKE